ncbi:FAD dependent oxidoreductase [Aspergillus germanicus]
MARWEAQAPNPASFPLRATGEGISYWIGEHPIEWDREFKDLSLPTDVDVAVIGSGITGAAVVYELCKARPGLRVAVLEARGICTGATGRNGGHLCRPEAYDIRQLVGTFGAEDAVRIRQLTLTNRDMTLDIVAELGIAEDIDLRLDGTLVVFKTAEQREAFAEDLKFGIEHGLRHEGHLLSAEEVVKKVNIPPAQAVHGGAFIARSGTLYPRKLVHALFKHAKSRMPSLTFHPFTPVHNVSYDASAPTYKYTVTSEKGSISARSVFHATNAYASHLLPELKGSNGIFGSKCHVMAIQPNIPDRPQLKPGFGYDDMWHWMIERKNGGPFLYGDSTAEVIGDYDDSVTLPEDHTVRAKMCRLLETMFPKFFENLDPKKDVPYDWTGIQGFTSNGASFVGRPYEERRGEFMSVGHNGEGMTRCISCATAVTGALIHYLDGDVDPWVAPAWLPMGFRRNI